jgi:hypothetical protein
MHFFSFCVVSLAIIMFLTNSMVCGDKKDTL